MNEVDIKKRLEAIQKDITDLIKQLDNNNNSLSKSFNKAIDKKTPDNQYVEALKQLKDLPFRLSQKQFAWIVAFTRFHSECGDDIINFFKSQLKRDNREQFVETVAAMLRKSYTTDYNQDFIEGAIKTIKELEV